MFIGNLYQKVIYLPPPLSAPPPPASAVPQNFMLQKTEFYTYKLKGKFILKPVYCAPSFSC